MVNRSPIKLNTVTYDEFVVTDTNGNLITGLVDGDFTKTLYNPSGSEVSGSITITISELGNGKYRVAWTPNTLGAWILTVYNATYFTYGKSSNYECFEELYDDIAGAVWDELLKDHVSAGSTGYRIKHLSSAFTKTGVGVKPIWTVREKEQVLDTINKMKQFLQTQINLFEADETSKKELNTKLEGLTLTVNKFADSHPELQNALSEISESITQLNNEIHGTQEMIKLQDKHKILMKEFITLKEQSEGINEKINFEPMESKIVEIKQRLSDAMDNLLNNNKIEKSLNEINQTIEDFVRGLAKTLSPEEHKTLLNSLGWLNEHKGNPPK